MSRRSVAAYVAEQTCPRCGTRRAPDQSYCVECGLRLPVATGALATWRRGWVRRLGWYPGDWAWTALLAGAVAVGGAAVAVRMGHQHSTATPVTTYVAPAPKLAAPPAARGRSGRMVWPRRLDAWTVILASTPAPKGQKSALVFASHAAGHGLPQVGVLRSDAFGTLHPGYFVIFSGVYGAAGDAQAALETVRARGYRGSYVQRVAP